MADKASKPNDRTAHHQFERRLFNPGEKIFKEGEPADSVFLVEDGKVEILKNRPDGGQMSLGYVNRGDVVGEMSLIDDQPRMATAQAVTATKLMVIPRYEFTHRISALDPVIRRILGLLAKRLRKVANEMAAQHKPFLH